jgi:archaellum component FlaC
MTIREANIKLKQLETEQNYWTDKKVLIKNKLTKCTSNLNSVLTQGGKIPDKYAELDKMIDEIEPKILNLEDEIRILRKFIEESLKIIGEYEPLEKKIIELRDEKKLKWKDIAEATYYSERQCQRIYDKYNIRTKDVASMSRKV